MVNFRLLEIELIQSPCMFSLVNERMLFLVTNE